MLTSGSRLKGHPWLEKENSLCFWREGKKEPNDVYSPSRLVGFPASDLYRNLERGFCPRLIFEDSFWGTIKIQQKPQILWHRPFYCLWFLFVPRYALPLEKCLFGAPKVTAEEQPWKVLVGWQLPPMEDLMRQVSTQEFDLFQVQRNSVTRLLPTFLVTLRYSWLKVSVASIAR